jgi:hypothetical protein
LPLNAIHPPTPNNPPVPFLTITASNVRDYEVSG